MQEIAGLGIWEQDYPTGKLWWSDKTFEIFGLKPEETGLSMDRFLKLVHPDDRRKVLDETEKFYESLGNYPYRVEYRLYRADGEQRYVREFADFVITPGETDRHVFGVVLDVRQGFFHINCIAFLFHFL